MLQSVMVTLLVICFALLIFFVMLSPYPRKDLYLLLRERLQDEQEGKKRVLWKFLRSVSPKEDTKLYNLNKRIIDYAEFDISVARMMLIRIVVVLGVAVILTSVRWTNVDMLKIDTLKASSDSAGIFGSYANSQDMNTEYKFAMYNSILNSIGERKYKSMTQDQKYVAIYALMKVNLRTNNPVVLDKQTRDWVRIVDNVSAVSIFSFLTFICIVFSAIVPDILFIVRGFLLESKYKHEVIRLENVFELLGRVGYLKTDQIISELTKASSVYKRILINFAADFGANKNLALKNLRVQARNVRFAKLVDVIRIHTEDRQVAREVLTRSKNEKDDLLYLRAQEDLDIIDLCAFASMLPVLWEVSNLFIKPLMNAILKWM